ncbi:DNA polymerase zeta catalytic subunit [Liparis tanakae]|uniref:DNA polymerase zeta catalytic subunit n=1 Tax=Liparis tanakae TaxID=230148 RepID=A0A4Z2J5Y6_9TELE|nr:DNA polymerase zeta catalytic subunit [Liparis tanakae]
MFAVRIVTADFYLATPIKDLDVCYSEFRESGVKKVPVVRIFGATPAVVVSGWKSNSSPFHGCDGAPPRGHPEQRPTGWSSSGLYRDSHSSHSEELLEPAPPYPSFKQACVKFRCEPSISVIGNKGEGRLVAD